MKYPDYHLHTEFSGDCRTPIRDLIASAKEKGLSEICITDHYDHVLATVSLFDYRSEEKEQHHISRIVRYVRMSQNMTEQSYKKENVHVRSVNREQQLRTCSICKCTDPQCNQRYYRKRKSYRRIISEHQFLLSI